MILCWSIWYERPDDFAVASDDDEDEDDDDGINGWQEMIRYLRIRSRRVMRLIQHAEIIEVAVLEEAGGVC